MKQKMENGEGSSKPKENWEGGNDTKLLDKASRILGILYLPEMIHNSSKYM